MASEDGFDGRRVGDVHALDFGALERGKNRLVRLQFADHHRNAAREEIAHHGGADEPRAPCDKEFHRDVSIARRR